MSDSSEEVAVPAIGWDAILKPGKAGDLATPYVLDPFVGLFPAVLYSREFSLANACVLAAHSMLVYRGYSDSGAPVRRGRHAILGRLGLAETFFGEISGTACSILEPDRTAPESAPVTVVFRGSSQFRNWLTNIQSIPAPWDGGGHVHVGFATAHDEIWDHLGPRIGEFVSGGRPIFFTGHSLGGALATLALSQTLGRHQGALACAYTFGSPRVGNAEFAASFDSAPLFRVVNSADLVTRLPFSFALSRRLAFLHAGAACFIDAAANLHLRGHGDLAEESASLVQVTNIIRNVSAAFKESRPPEFLSDHAPIRYLGKIRRALAEASRTEELR